MIAKLTGRLDELGTDSLVIDVGGVGYLVTCPRSTLAERSVGETLTLYIDSQTREDGTRLYGFASGAEREWFRLLQSVQGVGGKVAVAILSVLSVEALARALAAGDKAAIARADGVGPKLALRIATELKDKAIGAAFTASHSPVRPVGATAAAEPAPRPNEAAISALTNLGFGRSEAYAAVIEAARALGSDASIEALIRAGLKELSR
jgi:Holliday junction DNA helicase RuvA